PSPIPKPVATQTNNGSTPLPIAANKTAKRIETWLINWLANVLKVDAAEIVPDSPFAEYGLDSVTAIELADALEDWFDEEYHTIQIDTTVAWNFPTIESLADYLAQQLENDDAPEAIAETNTNSIDPSTNVTVGDQPEPVSTESDAATRLAQQIAQAKQRRAK
ncbi:MAG: acyl carrier protein, partial [Chloroflexota bacterium]